MHAIDLFEALAATPSRNAKEQLLCLADGWAKNLLVWAMDPYRTYGVKNIPAPSNGAADPVNPDELSQYIAQFGMLLDDLRTRRLVGNDARDMVTVFLAELPPVVAKWFHRVILKDLNCGVTAKTVNKVFPQLVPTFEVQLAHDASNGKIPIEFPVWGEYKLDGIRSVCVKTNDGVEFFTRNGHSIDTVPSLCEVIARADGQFVLDGELMGSSWNETQSTVFSTKNKADDSALFYNVFDFLPLEEWSERMCSMPFEERRQIAYSCVCNIGHTRVRLVGGEHLQDKAALDKFFERAVRQGFEGIMLKKLNALYEYKRTKNMLKIKPSSTWEGKICGWATGEATSKWRGAFGAFQVQFEEGGPVTSVGGGFTDDLRAEITKQLSLDSTFYNGKTVEVKGQEMKEGIVRFPVFVRFRDERDQS